MKIARWLEGQPQVEWVRYVGLPSHPQHDLAKRQMSGFGAMIAFDLKGGLEAGRTVMDNVRLATLAVSLGGVETLIEHPASMTHAGMSRQCREESGISDGLVRLLGGHRERRTISSPTSSRRWAGSDAGQKQEVRSANWRSSEARS